MDWVVQRGWFVRPALWDGGGRSGTSDDKPEATPRGNRLVRPVDRPSPGGSP